MDLIIHNANIKTMDKENPAAQAIAVKAGIIEVVGSNEGILALASTETKIIDAGGKTLIPGFNDSHMHLLGYAGELSTVDLNGTASIDEMIARIKDFIAKNNIPAGSIVMGSGWNQNFFTEKRNPDRYDLDKASTEHIIMADRACHHICSVNSTALAHFAIDKNTPDVEGGEIVRDENGEPLGIFAENARSLIKSNKSLEISEIEALILKAAPNLAKMGLTSIQSDDFTAQSPSERVYAAYTNLAKAGKLTFRVNQQCRALGYSAYEKIMTMEQTNEETSPYYKLGPIKVMADGSLGARTALMLEDYHDAPGTKGIPIYAQDELDKIAALAHNGGRALAIHAIGDGAMAMSISAIKKAKSANPKNDIRHGIVHCQITDSSMLKDFSDNDITAYIQPIFIHADWPIVASRVGEEKASTSYTFKTLKSTGVHTPFGTDCPVEKFNPFNNLYCAITRKDLNGQPENGYNPAEALSPEEAAYCYTAEGAYASYEENVKGMLRKGMYGDMVILSEDIFAESPEKILGCEVEMTVFDGKVIYSK